MMQFFASLGPHTSQVILCFAALVNNKHCNMTWQLLSQAGMMQPCDCSAEGWECGSVGPGAPAAALVLLPFGWWVLLQAHKRWLHQ